jgi:DNA-binding transcriptional LysR family regulator
MQELQNMGQLMKLEWLEDILAIADTGSFGGAAERRRLTQSAFSRRIKQIEDYVGVELFDRGHKPIQLKQTTIAQSDQIVMLTSALRQLAVDLRRGERITSNRIVIACQHSLTAKRVPSLLQKLSTERDGIYVRLRSANLDECTGMLLSRQADVAIVYSMPDEGDEVAADFVEHLRIGSDHFIPVFNKAWDDLTAGEMVEIPYITYPSEVFLGQVLERKILPFLDPCLQHIPKVETALTLAAVEMAKIGIGIAWVPQSLASESMVSGQLVNLSDKLPSYVLNINATRLTGDKNIAENAFWVTLENLC